MATCLEVITKAYAKPNIRPRGDALDADEAQAGLDALQSIYGELIGMGTLGRLTDVIATADYEAGENERVTPGAYTITRPTTVEDECTGEDRPPLDKSLIVVVGSESWVYSAPRGSWDQLTNLALTDFAPFSDRSLDGLASLLAVRICEENQKPVSQVLATVAQRFRGMLSHNPDSARTTGAAEYY